MPFRLCNAPSSFQAFIDSVMQGLTDKELITFLDNILIYGSTLAELQERTYRCLDHLKKEGLSVNLKKCQFEVTRVKFLGHIIEPGKLRMDPDKIDTLLDWPHPKSLKDV